MEYKLAFSRDQSIDQTMHYTFTEAFSIEELEWIDNLQGWYPFQQATVVGDNNDIRKSDIKWMHPDDKSFWVYEKITQFAKEANDTLWKFNLHSIIDSIQYTVYYEGGGHYGWHVDIGPSTINHRKVSCTLQLSDPDEYEGGNLEIWTGGEFKTIERKQGCAILFPSFLMHRITPVTKGIRRSLVLWMGGDSYK
jgi:PKHD-type hydroxylase